ncbi:MAG TPA: glycosyltransferase family 4 protein, partial [Longilinea sp.]|nr:glycosyltransferase family 4 protein [Longilinea sp.]
MKYGNILVKSGGKDTVRAIKADFQNKFGPVIQQQPVFIDEDAIKQTFLRTTRINEKTLGEDFVVHLLAPTFFDLNGNNMYYGGAERYLVELHHLFQGLGYELVVFQCANSSWVRFYHDLKVVGIDTGGVSYALLNKRFHEWVKPAGLTIYSPFALAQPNCRKNAIGISHGVFWDSYQTPPAKDILDNIISDILRAMKNLTWLVSVDTNTINWTRSQDYPLSTKWNYIPNFVDLSQFSPAAGKVPTKELVVLYPRRLYEARGFWLLAKQIPHLLKRCPNLVFHFVGKADLAEEVEVKHLEKVYPGKVKWFNYPPHEMPKVYQEADITVIPTLYSEGTSLSCLEALACKNTVIATTVGGLPDLIIPGHNGMLVKPDGVAISQAIADLVNDASLRARLAETGCQTAHAFRIEVWQTRWKVLLTKMLPSPEQARVPRAQVV